MKKRILVYSIKDNTFKVKIKIETDNHIIVSDILKYICNKYATWNFMVTMGDENNL